MAIDNKIRDEKWQFDINGEAAKSPQHYQSEKFINMNILHMKKY